MQVEGDVAANDVRISERFLAEGQGVVRFTGSAGRLHVEDLWGPAHVAITVGSRATVHIGENCNLGNCTIHTSDDSRITLGPWVSINGTVIFASHEPASITVGTYCLIGPDCSFSTSDVHRIYDRTTGERLNPPADVVIGDSVWIGARTHVMKGTTIGEGGVVGASSLVKGFFPPHALLLGSPARLVREDVRWEF